MSLQLEAQAYSTCAYSIASRLLSVQTGEARAARQAQSYFDSLYLTPCSVRVTDKIDCTITIQNGEPPSVPSHLLDYEIPRGRCYTDGEIYFLDVDESRIVVSPPALRRIDLWLGDTPHAVHPGTFINLMSTVMEVALRRCGLYDLHAAGVVEPASGAGMLFVGDSNSGKSSLTIRLARSGWSYLSDDKLVLYENPEGVEARALRRIFSASDASLRACELPRLDEALGAPVSSNPRKRRLEPSIVFPESFAESCTPRVLCFPVLTGEKESHLEVMSQAEVLTWLIKLNAWTTFDATARVYLNFLGRLVRQTKAYRLFAGWDLLDDPARAAALLAPYATA